MLKTLTPVAVLKRVSIPGVPRVRSHFSWLASALTLCFVLFAPGCARFHPHEQHETVYAWTREIYLRDRVAAVSNRVAEVTNGEELEVLEHGRRFLRVKTQKNEIGWIPDRAVIDSKAYDAFVQLAHQHKNDPVVATGTLRDDMYLHVSPGRDTDRFYLLPGNVKVQMLVRASVPKNAVNAPATAPKNEAPENAEEKEAKPISMERSVSAKPVAKAPRPDSAGESEPVLLEDWWLIRDNQGRTGWILGNRVDVDVPDDVAQYAEGQRIVGAYQIAKVHDDDANTPNHEVVEYVTALAPPKSGLPYDFDQIRVFTWSVKRHRYETGYRLHPIQGFLPVRITSEPAPGGTEPVFSFQVSSSPDIAINPETGIARPAATRTISFALRDTTVRRVGSDMGPIPTMHEPGEKAKPARKRK